MSNIENGKINDNNLSEEEKLEDDFILEENKNKIYEKNKFLIEKGNDIIINTIINLHTQLDIKDDELFEDIEKCFIYKIIDLSFIKIILEFVNQINLKEKIYALKEIYSFISHKEFKDNKRINIKKIISFIIQKNDLRNTVTNFKEVLLQMKIEIFFEIFNIKDIYMQKMITKCFKKNWNISSIIAFQKKLKYLFPLNEKRFKKKFERIQFETKERRLMLSTIEEFIYELNISKKIKKKENYNIKEIKLSFKNIYSNYQEQEVDFNKNIDIIPCAVQKTESLNLNIEHIMNKVSSIYEKIKKEKQKINELKSSPKENNIITNNTNNNEDNPTQNIKVNLIDIDENIYKEIRKKIIEIFNNKIKEIQEEIKFLAFIDYLFNENNWKNFFDELINSFDNNEIFLQKDEIKNMFNDVSQREQAFEIISFETEKILDDFIHKIKTEFYNEEYDSNKIKRFEHILLRKCSNLDYKTSLEIVKQILSQNILNEKGIFNNDLFNIQQNKKKEKKRGVQCVKIFYDSTYPNEIKEIKNIDDFILEKTFEFKKDLLLRDVNILYLYKNYSNPDILIFNGFTYKIKDIIIEVFNKSTEDITDIFDDYFISICQKILRKIKINLDMDIPINESFIETFEIVEV